MNPYFVWTKDDQRIIDLTLCGEIRMVSTDGLYEVRADPQLMAESPLGGLPDSYRSGVVLEDNLSAEDAKEYIEELRLKLNSNRSHVPGRPIITKIVSPEAFELLKTIVANREDTIFQAPQDISTLAKALRAIIGFYLANNPPQKETQELTDTLKQHFDKLETLTMGG